MTDPYQILGVSPTASDEEVKKAYRDLVRKYHPDRYQDSDMAALAGEKMKEINAAYEEIQKARAAKSGARGGSGDVHDGPSGFRKESDSPFYSRVRMNIYNGMLEAAENELRNVPPSQRGAEWYFLTGVVMQEYGFYMDALKYLDTACSMDPYNAEYRGLRDNLRNRGRSYEGRVYQDIDRDACCYDCAIPLICCC
ncbi:MAG: J domain-containing protein [Clostridia bacterium]|nr:J domain-containing protein [Clostridia bacterium]